MLSSLILLRRRAMIPPSSHVIKTTSTSRSVHTIHTRKRSATYCGHIIKKNERAFSLLVSYDRSANSVLTEKRLNENTAYLQLHSFAIKMNRDSTAPTSSLSSSSMQFSSSDNSQNSQMQFTEKDLENLTKMRHFSQNTHKFGYMSVYELEEIVRWIESISENKEIFLFLAKKINLTAAAATLLDDPDSGPDYPTDFHYAVFLAMTACSKMNSIKGARLAQRLLWCYTKTSPEEANNLSTYKYYDDDEQHGEQTILPTKEMYTVVLDAWQNSNATRGYGAKNAQGILVSMQREYIKAFTQTLEQMIEEINHQHIDEDETLQLILEIIEDLPKAKPDFIHYSTVISAWAKSNQGRDGAMTTQRIFDYILLSNENNAKNKPELSRLLTKLNIRSIKNQDLIIGRLLHVEKPDTRLYNTVMSAWARSGHKDAPKIVESLFSSIFSPTSILIDENEPVNLPDKHSYAILIDTYARFLSHKKLSTKITPKQKQNAVKRVEFLLKEMHELYENSDQRQHQHEENSGMVRRRKVIKPDTIIYNSVLNVLGRSKNPIRAMAILEQMEQMAEQDIAIRQLYEDEYDSDDEHDSDSEDEENSTGRVRTPLKIFPTTSSYNTVMNAWALSGRQDSGIQAERIFRRMIEKHLHYKNLNFSKRAAETEPNTITYNTLINAQAKGMIAANEKKDGVTTETISSDVAYKCQAILDSMLCQYIPSYLEGKHQREIQDHFIQQNQRATKDGVGIDYYDDNLTYRYSIPKPNTITIATVIHTWSLIDDSKAPLYAHELLNLMLNHHLHQGKNDYGDGIVGSFEYGQLDILPNAQCFQGVINAYLNNCNINNKENVDKAEDILKQMYELAPSSNNIKDRRQKRNYIPKLILPNSLLCNAVINGWINDCDDDNSTKITRTNNIEDLKRAYELVQWIENTKQIEMRTKRAYKRILQACDNELLLSSTSSSDVDDSSVLLLELIIGIYNSIKETNEETNHKMRNTRQSKNDRRSYFAAAQETYECMFSILSKCHSSINHDLFSDEKETKVSEVAGIIFEDCCNDGLLNKDILESMKKVSSEQTFRECIGRLNDSGSPRRDARVSSTLSDPFFDEISIASLPRWCSSKVMK